VLYNSFAIPLDMPPGGPRWRVLIRLLASVFSKYL